MYRYRYNPHTNLILRIVASRGKANGRLTEGKLPQLANAPKWLCELSEPYIQVLQNGSGRGKNLDGGLQSQGGC